jgi:amino acid adenylation domain-containing protein
VKNRAIVDGKNILTYRELLELSLLLARQLSGTVAEGQTICHVALGNCAGQIISLLASMRARLVYCPLNTDEPLQIIQHKIIRNALPALFIATSEEIEMLRNLNLIQTGDKIVLFTDFIHWVWVDDSLNETSISITENLPDPEPSQPAYLVFTSGSTGKPKGILGRSDSLTQFIAWEKEQLSVQRPVSTAWITRFTFDASFRDIFLPLLTGGTVMIAPKEIQENMILLATWLEVKRPDILHLVPSVFKALTSELDRSDKNWQPSAILLAGEKIYTKDAERWLKLFPDTDLYNLYGASETTMIRTFHKIDQQLKGYGATIPAGTPIHFSKVAVIKNNRICSPCEVGEVVVKTPFSTLGYFNDKILTRTVFFQNPLNPDDDILYKTGDLGFINRNGLLEITGRSDQQIKINGIRVELSAVENTIAQQAGIGQVVVLQSEEDKQLVAFFTTDGQIEIPLLKLQLAISCYLPHKSQHHWMPVDTFPLNAHGKIDRRKLSFSLKKGDQPSGFVPLNQKQKQIGELWKELTGNYPSSETERFFDAGGNSLSAMVFIGRIKKTFGIDVGFKAFFLNATVPGIEKLLAEDNAFGSIDIPAIDKQPYYEISHAQHRMWVLHQMEESSITYNMKRAFIFREQHRQSIAGKGFDFSRSTTREFAHQFHPHQ